MKCYGKYWIIPSPWHSIWKEKSSKKRAKLGEKKAKKQQPEELVLVISLQKNL